MDSFKKSIIFLRSNPLYIIWFLIYFNLAWLILGVNLRSFMWVSIIYAISIGVALSPIGEALLRLLENCREPATEQEQSYLLPLFDEVYEDAKEVYPELNDKIKIYIMDAMYVNAFAIGRETVAITKGALETFTADELKGVIAHELGHMMYGHTKAMLLSFIGNFFFAVIVWGLRVILYIVQIISSIVEQSNMMGTVFTILTFISKMFVEVSAFIIINLSQMLLAFNSRKNEFQADAFAYEIGYGRELTAGLYLIQKISMNRTLTLSEIAKASHPHVAERIRNLETLENQLVEA